MVFSRNSIDKGGDSIRVRMSKDERRIQICEVARKMFLEKGFENVTMKDIMNETGISVGGLYHHYANIYEILGDLIVHSQKYKNNILFEIRKNNPDMSLDDAMVETVVLLLFDESDYSKLYIMLMIAINSDGSLHKIKSKIDEKMRQEYLDFLKELGSDDYKCFISDEFINFMNIFKIGNYHLKYEGGTEEVKSIYREFIKIYLDKHRK